MQDNNTHTDEIDLRVVSKTFASFFRILHIFQRIIDYNAIIQAMMYGWIGKLEYISILFNIRPILYSIT